MQAIEGCVDEDVAAVAWLERRGQADMTEPHRRDTRKRRRPCLQRTRHQRMQMIDIDWNPRRRMLTMRATRCRIGADSSRRDNA